MTKKTLKIVSYYLYKAWNRLRLKVFLFSNKRARWDKGEIFVYLPKGFKFSGKIIFAFTDPRLIHLGDQLFFQPLIDFLNKKTKIIMINKTPLLGYFQALEYSVFKNFNLMGDRGNIIISKPELFPKIFKKLSPEYNFFVGIDFSFPKSDKKVARMIFDSVLGSINQIKEFKGAGETRKEMNCHFLPDNLAEKIELSDRASKIISLLRKLDKKIYLFNNYVASNFLGVRKKEIDKLIKIAKEKKNSGYYLVHIGSKADKETDNREYSFIDLDIRGKINPVEMFVLMSLPNVEGVISFDTFIFHIASLFSKKSYLALKSRGEKENEKVKKVFIPMADCLDNENVIII